MNRQIVEFIRRSTFSDILALGAFAVGALVTLADTIGLWDVLSLKPIETIILILVSTLILYSVIEKREILKRNEDLQKVVQSYGTVSLVLSENEIFEKGIELLNQGKYSKIKIFAPVGLWNCSNAKKRWFNELRRALEEQRLVELQAVFGLPPTVEMFDQVLIGELESFRDVDGARIRYLPPPNLFYGQLPGTGVLLMVGKNSDRDSAVGLAFAVHGHHTVVDSTVFITKREVTTEVSSWFEEVWNCVRDNQIKEVRFGKELDEGLREAREIYNQLPC